jgi:hypothetical protein
MEGDLRAIEQHLATIAAELHLIREALEAQAEYEHDEEDEDEDEEYEEEEEEEEEP